MHIIELALTQIPWFAWIAIIAIVSGATGGAAKMFVEHRERMAMIRMGIHPDAKHGEEKPYAYGEQEV